MNSKKRKVCLPCRTRFGLNYCLECHAQSKSKKPLCSSCLHQQSGVCSKCRCSFRSPVGSVVAYCLCPSCELDFKHTNDQLNGYEMLHPCVECGGKAHGFLYWKIKGGYSSSVRDTSLRANLCIFCYEPHLKSDLVDLSTYPHDICWLILTYVNWQHEDANLYLHGLPNSFLFRP